MDSNEKDRLLDALLHEYNAHRDEIVTRITLQNQMTERGLNATFLMAGLLATLATFFLKDFAQESKAITIAEKLSVFLAVAIPLLVVHGVLVQLTIAGWVYQLGMIFRITRYWNWMAKKKLSFVITQTDTLFLWDRLNEEAPWLLAVDRGVLRYFQLMMAYALAGLNLLVLTLALVYKCWLSGPSTIVWVGIGGMIVLLFGIGCLLFVHLCVHSGTEMTQSAAIQPPS